MEFRNKTELVNAIRKSITTNDKAALRALTRIYAAQTADEQHAGHTKHFNGVGFNGSDSAFLSSLAEQYSRKGSLSEKQLYCLKKRIGKYASQITENAINSGLYIKQDNKYTVA